MKLGQGHASTSIQLEIIAKTFVSRLLRGTTKSITQLLFYEANFAVARSLNLLREFVVSVGDIKLQINC